MWPRRNKNCSLYTKCLRTYVIFKAAGLHWRGMGLLDGKGSAPSKMSECIFFLLRWIARYRPVTTSLGTLCSPKSGVITAFTTEEMEGWRRNEGSWACEDGKAYWVISLWCFFPLMWPMTNSPPHFFSMKCVCVCVQDFIICEYIHKSVYQCIILFVSSNNFGFAHHINHLIPMPNACYALVSRLLYCVTESLANPDFSLLPQRPIHPENLLGCGCSSRAWIYH